MTTIHGIFLCDDIVHLIQHLYFGHAVVTVSGSIVFTQIRFGHRFDNTTLHARNCSTVLLYFYVCVCIYVTFISICIPVPMVTYTRQELFVCTNAIVSGGKLPQPLFDTIKVNGICAVTRGCRAGRSCNRQRTVRPVTGRRPVLAPLSTNAALTTITLPPLIGYLVKSHQRQH